MAVTRAQERVLRKAAEGGVQARGGFAEIVKRREAGVPDLFDDTAPPSDRLDREYVISRMVNDGLLTWGEGANEYIPTAKGNDVLARRDRQRARRAAS
ncbi:hypothetical protein M0638_28310 [Roseomonas sp. NAR14]|uniref:Uncharacterized protein n=1 Tax=Roseomonas acroporae TaxID=2937791 RepID=A0A9X1YD84_9PROT|nr:hypothetical protein [Roseomonas acroporae]MCK8788259.1 hypothetical protein [Roseomonas acroporae]